jgi:DNA-directed RNA polymerase subunit RPC12/RpoP
MPIVPTKTYRDFKEESNKLREQKQKGDGPTTAPVITVEEEPVVATQITLTTCPSCNGRTSMDDITTCSKCGKIVCSNCSTQNGGLMEDTPKIYCNECWDKQ